MKVKDDTPKKYFGRTSGGGLRLPYRFVCVNPDTEERWYESSNGDLSSMYRVEKAGGKRGRTGYDPGHHGRAAMQARYMRAAAMAGNRYEEVRTDEGCTWGVWQLMGGYVVGLLPDEGVHFWTYSTGYRAYVEQKADGITFEHAIAIVEDEAQARAIWEAFKDGSPITRLKQPGDSQRIYLTDPVHPGHTL